MRKYRFCILILKEIFFRFFGYNSPIELVSIIVKYMYSHNDLRVHIGYGLFIAGYDKLFAWVGYSNKTNLILPNEQIESVCVSNNQIIIITTDYKVFSYANFNKPIFECGSIMPSRFLELAIGNVQTICLTNDSFIGLMLDGNVKVWGSNLCGQLGLGDQSDRPLATLVPGLNHICRIDCGFGHMIAVSIDGHLYSWGSNHFDQLGLGCTSCKSTPQKNNLTNILSANCGAYNTILLTKSGDVYACGENDVGQLGIGSYVDQQYLVRVDLVDVYSIKTAYYHSIALTNSGIYVWAIM